MAGRGGITSRKTVYDGTITKNTTENNGAWFSYASSVSGAFYVDLDSASTITINMHFSHLTVEEIAALVAAGTTLTTEHYIEEEVQAAHTATALTKYKPTTLDDPIMSMRMNIDETGNSADAVLKIYFVSFDID